MQTKALPTVHWSVSLRDVLAMHDQAWLRLSNGELDDVHVAEDFLNKLSGKLKFDAFELTHNQLRLLCQLSGCDPRPFLFLEVPYEIPRPGVPR